MPVVTAIGTIVNSPAPPEINIRVSNGSTGQGESALVTVHVTWDPSVMLFDSVVAPTARVTVGSSWCTWTDYSIGWGQNRGFKLILDRRTGDTNETYVVATATDARSGDWDTDDWQVPPGHPQEP